jgi:hypothetical protein
MSHPIGIIEKEHREEKRDREKSNNNWPNFKPKTEATKKADWLCIKYI